MLYSCRHTPGQGGQPYAKSVFSIELVNLDGKAPDRKQVWALCPECARDVMQFLDTLGGEVPRGTF